FDAGWACLGPCARLLGELAALEGDRDAALEHYEQALAVAAQAGARPWVAQSACDLARLLAGTPRGAELAASALATARELGLDGLAEQALSARWERAAAAPAARASTLDVMAQTIESETPARLEGVPAAPSSCARRLPHRRRRSRASSR